jgi:hypothetical protein
LDIAAAIGDNRAIGAAMLPADPTLKGFAP